jgi:hydrogenase/urease accessory protein HupE
MYDGSFLSLMDSSRHFVRRAERLRTLFRVALLASGLATAASAHITGSSSVDIRLSGSDSIWITVSASPTDYEEALHRSLHLGAPESRRADANAYQEGLADYLRTRLRPETDQGSLDLHVLRWKPGGTGPEDGFDSASYFRNRHIVTLGGILPAHRSWMRLGIQLFAELGVQPISEASVYWKETLVKRVWLGPDQSVRIPLLPDSLEALAQAAGAHAAGSPPGQGAIFLRFIGIGFAHILPFGFDHVLFVLGLFFFATRLRPLLAQITAFTVAHSLTLGLSLIGIIALPSRVVEPLIALSIAVVGLENIFTRRMRASRWLIVFAFGLVHGLGFASALRDFGLPPGSFWSTLLGFNLGVEIGQLTVVTAAYAAVGWLWGKPWYFRRVVVPCSAAITLVALYWAVQRVFAPG